MNAIRPLRIGLIAPPWIPVPPIGYGGSETVIDELARGLAGLGHEITLFTTGDSTCPVARASVIAKAPGVHVGGSAVEMQHVIRAYEAFEGYDIVHDHTAIGPLYAASVIAGPVVTTNHNGFGDPLATIYREISDRIPVVAISHHHAASAAPLVPAAVIHHGIDPSTFYLGDGQGGYALFLGRMCKEKGVRQAIDITKAAGIPLVIAAKMESDEEVEYFHREVSPLLDADHRFVGEADRAQKRELLSNAYCLINPIIWDEPFGMVMIEAFASGTPVVARRRGAAPEIVADGLTGFLGSDDDELVDALRRVDRIDRAACRAAATGYFSAERMVNEYLTLYRSVIDSATEQVIRRLDWAATDFNRNTR